VNGNIAIRTGFVFLIARAISFSAQFIMSGPSVSLLWTTKKKG
jgi:hypothetical protein